MNRPLRITTVPSRREDVAARSKPRSRRRLGWSFAIALLLLAPPVFAQAPDATWNLTGTDATNSITDCFGTDYNGIPESGNACQSYTTDTYENWDGTQVGSGDTDIEVFSIGLDSTFFYYELELRESWDYDGNGPNHQYHFELDVDWLTEVGRGDYLLKYSPNTTHLGSTWILADDDGDGQFNGFQDDDDDVNGPDPSASDYDCGFCTGYEAAFKTASDTYVRIITRGGKQIPQIAIRASAFPGPVPTTYHVRSWVSVALAAEQFSWHDRNSTADMIGVSFDNTHGADTSSWLEPFPGIDLVLAKTVDDTTPNEGDTVTYTVLLTNNGPDTATNIVVTDVVPAGVTYVAASITGGDSNDDTDPAGAGLSWTVNSLTNGSSTSLTFQATVDAGTAGSTITNTATKTQDQADSNATADDPSEDITVEPFVAAVVKRAFLPDGTPIPTGATIPSGLEFKFLLYINNAGVALSDISVRDALDAAFLYQPGTIRVDNSVAECALVACTAGEELTIFAAVDGAAVLSDALGDDVVSCAAPNIDAGDGNAGNLQLDINADAVWAILFSVEMP